MLSSLFSSTPQKQLITLIKKAIHDPDIDQTKLLKDITVLVEKGANLNKKLNNKTLTYYLLMHIPDFNFAQKILELGADPRIKNNDGTNLFMQAANGRGIFMQICWLDYIGINMNLDKKAENYTDTIKSALLIYYFCNIQEIQKLHQFECKKNNVDEVVNIFKKIKILENCMKNNDFAAIQYIQKNYLFYSQSFDKNSIHLDFEVLATCKISSIKPGPQKTKPV